MICVTFIWECLCVCRGVSGYVPCHVCAINKESLANVTHMSLLAQHLFFFCFVFFGLRGSDASQPFWPASELLWGHWRFSLFFLYLWQKQPWTSLLLTKVNEEKAWFPLLCYITAEQMPTQMTFLEKNVLTQSNKERRLLIVWNQLCFCSYDLFDKNNYW